MRISPHPVLLLVALLASCAHENPQAGRSAGQGSSDPGWIVGNWESVSLDYGAFGEWSGASKLQVVAFAPDDIDLVLVSATGQRRRAHDSWPGHLEREFLFFGPIGSGLLFRYRRDGTNLHLHLDASGTRIEAALRRVGPPPPETERLPGRYVERKK